MKIFLIAGDFPSASHTTRAANRVLDALITEFCRRGHEVVLQVIAAVDLKNGAQPATKAGLTILPPFEKKDFVRPAAGANLLKVSSRIYSRISNPIDFFYHASRLRSFMEQRIAKTQADLALIFWNSEGLAATYGYHRIPKIAYYGVPDHFASLARLEDHELFGVKMSPARLALERRNIKDWEAAHIELMKDCDVVTNLCAEHADYYRQHGHPRSLYIPNVWPFAPDDTAQRNFPLHASEKLRIFGSLGSLSATGNTYGLKYIAEELAPRLDKRLGPDAYEIHIFGSGNAAPSITKLLQRKNIHMRGWVENIDEEIRKADIFLVANNTGRYRGAHTRFLHAWSLRACCVGHTYNAQAMPEIIHMKNTLLGETPDEIVEMIMLTGSDRELRDRIAGEGWKTFREHFSPEAVVEKLLSEMESLIEEKRGVTR